MTMTLQEWNTRRGPFEYKRYPRYNGIMCDRCGHELMDSDNNILASDPPQRNVHCPNCGLTRFRFL